MDFFAAQDLARRHTLRLVILLALAVLSLVVITNLLVMVLFGFLNTTHGRVDLNAVAAQFDWGTFFGIGALVSLVILAGSAYKTLALAAGGATVAESLGGRLLAHDTRDLHERKALNVVEEMAIASGMPVPPVYLLEHEEGINAFAAGFTPSDAVIGLTRGTITYLNREELQGVVGHEFSHILNGDMRLNLRLVGVLHGILLIGLIGYFLLRTMGGSRSNSKNGGAILGLGLGLMVIGYAGTFFGNLIKASVSRQREFLADASSVQFTRSKDSIAGALKKIGGYAYGSELHTPRAPTMSHAYFSRGVSASLQSVFATHPPLEVRIKRIDPGWNGVFTPVTQEVNETQAPTAAKQTPAATRQQAVAGAVIASQLINSVGQTTPAHLEHAARLVNGMPPALYAVAHEPYGARALIYCLVISPQPAVQATQLRQLERNGDTGILALVNTHLAAVKTLAVQVRLPLIDITLPALHRLSAQQYERFKQNLQFLIEADKRIDLFEWVLQKILLHHLEPVFTRAAQRQAVYSDLASVQSHIEVLVSMLVYTCAQDQQEIDQALDNARQLLDLPTLRLFTRDHITIKTLDSAVDNLALLKPLLKPRLLKACLAAITRDQHYSPTEMELMRAVADTLDCPLPPYLG